MGLTVAQKILIEHRQSLPERMRLSFPENRQVLTQDATGTMVYLQFEAIGLPRIQIPLAVSYVDHNILQVDSRNADDHRFLRSAAARYGAYFSPPGNGICHQLHLENFARPERSFWVRTATPHLRWIGNDRHGLRGLISRRPWRGSL